MSQRPQLPVLDPRICDALRSVERQIRLRTGLETVLLLIAIVLGTFWIGFLVDRTPTFFGGREMPWTARGVLLFGLLTTSGYLFFKGMQQGPLRKFTADGLALLLERRFKHLDGRLLTSVQLLNRDQPRTADFAPSLLERVHRQAAEAITLLRPTEALRWEPVTTMAAYAGPLALASFLFGMVAPDTAKQALSRLLLVNNDPWPRKSHLEALGLEIPLTTLEDSGGPRETRLVEFSSGVVRVARGEPAELRVRAKADDAIIPEVCTVYYRTASGMRGQANMRRAGKPVDNWQLFLLDGAPLDAISENMQLEVRGGDARVDDLRIEVVEPPAISKLNLVVVPPNYLFVAGMVRSVRPFQAGIRVPEGSQLFLEGDTTSPLMGVLASVTRPRDSAASSKQDENPEPHRLTATIKEGTGEFRLDLGTISEPLTCRLVPIDHLFVRSTAPYRYLISVMPDLLPIVTVRLKGIGDAVTARAILPTTGTAIDDYRVYEPQLELRVTPSANASTDNAGPEAKSQGANWKLNLKRDGEFAERLDLEQLTLAKQLPPLVPGTMLTIFAEATDAYDLGPKHTGTSDRIVLEVVSPDNMLARLESRELSLRSRLQEVIRETEQLRELLDQIRREGWPTGDAPKTTTMLQTDEAAGNDATATDRTKQLMLLRASQASLQMTKSREETEGILSGVDDILEELANNRLDTPDRRERLVGRVRQPLASLVETDFRELDRLVDQLPAALLQNDGAPQAATAVRGCEQVLLRLDEILKGMLELEGYNELLDLVRELIDDQGNLIQRTEQKQKSDVLDLFN